ncbi:MAG: hypothetical protein HUK22_08730, partial [Thermoguttaceae bacterium]|nr:hypothetical protein [Thermoguttaceae bacterium]
WATPAFKYLDEWKEYVRRIVERFKDRIRFWEVWNEPNLQGFWADAPDGANYAILLKATYETIKAIDPELKVVYGGLAGVPLDFFEKSLDAGAGDYFDVMNIHPYRGGMTTTAFVEEFRTDVEGFRAAMAKRGFERPIWITEMGWATPPVFGENNVRMIDAGLRRRFPGTESAALEDLPKVALFYDLRYEPTTQISKSNFADYLPARYRASGAARRYGYIDAEKLKALTPEEYSALIMPPSEYFPGDCLEAMANYVKAGGILFLLGGVPLYYRYELEDGVYKRRGNNPTHERDLDALRISWYAWWTRKDVPESCQTSVAPEVADELAGYYPVVSSSRFFDDAKLKPGDTFIPLLNGRSGDFVGASACML